MSQQNPEHRRVSPTAASTAPRHDLSSDHATLKPESADLGPRMRMSSDRSPFHTADHREPQPDSALRTRADIESAEERYRLATELYDALVWDWDIETGRQFRSRPPNGFLGYSPEEIRDESDWWRGLVHPDDIQAIVNKITDAMDAGLTRVTQTYRFRRRDGTYAVVEDRGQILYREGKASRLVISLRDVTASHESRQALALSESRFRALATANAVGVWRVDGEGRFLEPPTDLLRLLPATLRNIKEIDFRRCTHPDDIEEIVAKWSESLATGQPYRAEQRVLTADGSFRWHLVQAVPIRDSTGRITERVGSHIDIHAARETADSLRRAMTMQKAVMWSSSALLSTCNPEGETVEASEGFERLTGMSLDEYRGMGWQKTYHPDDLPTVLQRFEVAKSRQEPCEWEYRLRLADGTYRWFFERSVPMFDDKNRLEGWGCVNVDIHEYKLAQQALVESQSKFRTLAETTPDPIYVMLPSGLVEYVNPAYTRWSGYTLEDYNALRLNAGTNTALRPILAHPDDLPNVEAAMARLWTANEPVHLEYRFRRKTGEYRWVLGSFVPVEPSVAGAPPGRYVGSLTDIDDRRQLETLLREQAQLASEQQHWLERIIEALPIPITVVDEAGKMIYRNDAMRKMVLELTGESDTTTGMKQVRRLDANGDDLARENWPHNRVASGNHMRGDEISLIGKFGRRTGHMYSATIPALMGRSQTSVLAYQDVSRLKQVERDLRDASEAKDRFLAVLSHELRTPLTPVLTLAQLLERDPTMPAEHRDSIAVMRRNVELEVKLIDDLLDLTRITRGKLRLDRKPLDLRDTLRSVVGICHADLRGKAINFELQLGDVPVPVSADAARLHQIFWNLLKNAIQFTPERGQITLSLDLAAAQESGAVAVRLRDNGIGIPADLLPRVFDAFMQGDHDVRHHGGLGLGLAIARALIELHGGTLTASSLGPGRGAEFIATLPASDSCPLPPPAAPGTQLPTLSARVLVVEDHPDTARVLHRLLTKFGHRVTAVGTVAAAIAALKSSSFDLLLSDISLPDGTGYDLMRQTAHNAPPRPPAIALSGFGMDEDLQRSEAAGFVEHLTKPVDAATLESTILRFTAKS